MDSEAKLISELRKAGISQSAIRAAWPSWWSDDLVQSPSGKAELRFALARRLGLEPKPLLGERVEFIWNDEARFKHLTTEDAEQRSALASFAVSVGRLLLRATPPSGIVMQSAADLRAAILATNPLVDLATLVGTCWAIGIPVAYLRVFPLEAKSMHAMVASIDGRFAILLGRDSRYPAPVAFTLAHELGHAALGHLAATPALIDLADPATGSGGDAQEEEADRFALELLTGSPEPDIRTGRGRFNAPSLAQAVVAAANEYHVEPGTLALCVGHRYRNWPVAMSALKFIYGRSQPVWPAINHVADRQLDWATLGEEATDFLKNVMSDTDA